MKVATEHLLLALLAQDRSVAVKVLEACGTDIATLRELVLSLAPHAAPRVHTLEEIPYSGGAKRVLELAMTVAGELQHSCIGAEHLLLALMREARGVAARALEEQGLSHDTIRSEVLRFVRAAEDGERSAQPDLSLLESVTIFLKRADGNVVQRMFSSPQEAKDYLDTLLDH